MSGTQCSSGPTHEAAAGFAVPAAALPMSLERFGQIVGAIYEAALDPAQWVHSLEELRPEFGADYVSLIVRAGSPDDLGVVVSAAGGNRVLDAWDPAIALSPFRGLPVDKLVTLADLLSEPVWRETQYYRDWCEPHGVYHVLAVDIGTSNGGVFGLRLTRPQSAPAFAESDFELLRRLLPHLKRALNMHLKLNHGQQVNTLYGRAMAHLMVGVIVLDEHGSVIECNPMARAILDAADGLKISGGQLEATYALDNRKLQRLIREALGHQPATTPAVLEAVSVSRPSGKVGWGLVLRVISPDEWTEGRHRPSVAVFVRDAERKAQLPVRLAQQLFQLTAAETSLAIQLANGLSLDEASDMLNIRRNTARAHLRSIFSKTGVRRQTELVRIFLNSVALLGTNE